MARTSVGILPSGSQLGITLDRYAQLMGLDMCGFNGVNRPTTHRDNACVAIVNQSQRDMLAMFLLQAEQKREEEIGYFLSRKWMYNEEHDLSYGNPFTLRMKYLHRIGFPASIDIELDVAVDYGIPPFDADSPPNDPVTLDVTTDVATNEIVVAYPGENVAIHPTSIVDNGDGTVTISIPRCRLVKPSCNDDRDDPVSYYDSDAFLETVDVYRHYIDESLGATFLWLNPGCVTDCEPKCQMACPTVMGPDAYTLSIVHLFPASYSDGWTRKSFTYRSLPDVARVSYVSGRYPMMDEIGTIRLAHTLMPRPPCGCDLIKQKWEDDNMIVDRTFTKYGSRRGAVEVWMFDQQSKIGHGGMLGASMRHYG